MKDYKAKSMSSHNLRDKHYIIILSLFLFACTLFRYYYIFTGPNGLSPDETQYWQWSRHLDLSYYAKGPVIAYLIAFSTWLMGDNDLGVRFFAPILLALTSLILYRTVKVIFDDAGTAFASAVTIQIIPLFSVHGLVMTIDPPFVFFWTLSLYLFWKAVYGEGNPDLEYQNRGTGKEHLQSLTSDSGLLYWLLLGLTIGLGLLTKYIMVLFYAGAFLFLLTSGERRWWLKKKEPYLAFVFSIIVFSPVIIWNMNHDWVSLKHTAGHAHVAEGFKISFADFFEFIGSQIGVISPLLFFAMMKGAIKNRRSTLFPRGMTFLFWFWAPVLVFFIVKSLQAKVQANWAMVAYITILIASADFYLNRHVLKKWEKIYFVFAFCMAFFVTAAAHYPSLGNLPVKLDSTARLRGWKELGIKTEAVYNSMVSATGEQPFIFSDRFQVSSELAFYMPSKPATYLAKLGSRRMNQYDIWGGFDQLAGRDAIFVTSKEKYRTLPDMLRNAFDSYEKETFTVMERGRVLRIYYIFKCYGFKGLEPPTFTKY